ncbi:MAG: TerB family tellurite resistance protein [Ignavibacteriales bacterium]|nr:TerB family tellurite resistance protein [Ignavibacteriales bacterium]
MIHLNKSADVPDKTLANRNKLQILIFLAAGDSEIHQSESDLIRDIGAKMGFSDDEIATEIVEFNRDLRVVIPEEKREKFSLIYDLFQIMLIDGVVTIEEVAIISKISFMFGFPAFKLKEFYTSLVKSNAIDETKEKCINRILEKL